MIESRQPGLPSLNASRVNRHRQLVTGRSPIGGIPPKLFMVGLAVLVVISWFYLRDKDRRLSERKNALLAKQRAAYELLAPKLLPLEKSIYSSLSRLGASDGRPLVAPGVDFEKLLESPAIYLRMRQKDASDEKRVRASAQASLRDGLSTCLLKDPKAPLPTLGKSCDRSEQCQAGEFCTEYGVCQRPSSPFNLRLLYRSLVVLSDAWIQEVKETPDDLGVSAYERGLDAVTRVDIPIAIEVYQRAKFVLLVLDQESPAGLPPPIPGALESEAERLQRVPHPVRVGLYSLPEGTPLAEFTSEASGELRPLGSPSERGGAESKAAQARQANGCAVAMDLKARLLAEEK